MIPRFTLPAFLLLAACCSPLSTLGAMEASARTSDAASSPVLADDTVITISGDTAADASAPEPAPASTPDLIWFWLSLWFAAAGADSEETISGDG